MIYFRFFLIGLLVIFSLVYGRSQGIDMSPYESFLADLKGHESLEYDVLFKRKRFADQDTSSFRAHVVLIKDNIDSLFGGQVLIDMDSIWFGYDGKWIMAGDRKNSELTYGDPQLTPKVFIKSTYINELIVGRFFQPTDFIRSLKNISAFRISLINTSENGNKFLKANIFFPKDSVFTNEKLTMTFDGRNHFYHQNVHTLEYEGQQQLEEWTFSNVSFGDQKEISTFHADSIRGYKKFITYSPNAALETDVNNLGFLHGRILGTYDTFKALSHDPAPFTFLVFWYTGCVSCGRVVPVINQLKSDFTGKDIRFYGVNNIDNASMEQSLLTSFRDSYPMDFMTIMSDIKLDDHIPIHGYPTIMILNQHKDIIYHKTGYSDDLYEKLTNAINGVLSNRN